MASLILIASELVRNHEWDAATLLAAYPPSYSTTATSWAAAFTVRKPLKDEGVVQKNSHRTEESVVENPLESRVCVDFVVWP
ncbi:hypothetical protein VNO77_16819 [Canavalia gladiata]|uniref:Uncharacterized protein n=1 Tax=Canavalia gladiata TaxID=3824 RepID=A0AAN9LLG3_CANGL